MSTAAVACPGLQLIESRHSMRAFLPEAVPRATLEQILANRSACAFRHEYAALACPCIDRGGT